MAAPLLERLSGTRTEHDKAILAHISKANTHALTQQRDDQNIQRLAPYVQQSLQRWNSKAMVSHFAQGVQILNPIDALAVILLLENFPESWHKMVQAAFTVLCKILAIIREDNLAAVYPPCWSKEIFLLESLLRPTNISSIVFGIDPISHANPLREFATGIAFSFDVPLDERPQYRGGNAPSTTKGLKGSYEFAPHVDFLKAHDVQAFLKRHCVALINYIRTIDAGSNAGSRNRFRFAWDTFNLAWLQTVQQLRGHLPPVLTFQNEHYALEGYVSQVVLALFGNAPRCSHPSYIVSHAGHCLMKPHTTYSVQRPKLILPQRTNASVTAFMQFMAHQPGLCQCRCQTCVAQAAAAVELELELQFGAIDLNAFA